MHSPSRLVVGTLNRKKGLELAELLAASPIRVLTLSDFPPAEPVVEDGQTFADNARTKAVAHAKRLGEWVLADDSGLCVDALDGEPGIHSARFAGDDEDDEANNRKLLELLSGAPLARRTAHYVCHVTLADPAGQVQAESEDYCHGRILEAASGIEGFGYDPLFEIVEYHRTFGELPPAVKACLSHRARAMRHILPSIVRLLAPE